jgi:hypothetical protein
MDREVRVEGHRLVRAPLHRVWQLLSRLESHPRYASLWLTADLLERSQTSAVVEFRGFFGGLPITSVQRVVLRAPGRIEFKQVRGTLRGLSGAYVLRDADGETHLVAQAAADPGMIFFPEASVRQILAAYVDGTLTKIKASAERDLTRPPAARRSAADSARAGRSPEASATGEPTEPAESEELDETEGETGEEPEETRPEVGAQPGGTPAGTEPRVRKKRRRRRRRGGAPRRPAPAA